MRLCLSGVERIFTFSVATMVDNLKLTGLLPIATEGKFGKDLKKKLKERSKKFVVAFNGKSTTLWGSRHRGGSRPSDKGGGGASKKFFWPFGPQFTLTIRGGGGGPLGPSSGSAPAQ